MIWSEGYTTKYYITIVDPMSWRDIARMEITDGSIDRSLDELMESADLGMTELPEGIESWVRIWMDAEQGGIEHVALFTGLASCPTREIEGQRETYKVECFSVLKPVDDILLERGFYVPAEIPAPVAAARLLRQGIAPVTIADVEYPSLTDTIVAEDGETCLTMVRRILDATNWQLRINGRGEITLQPKSDDVVSMFDVNVNDIMEMTVSDECDWYSCPNVFRAISDDLTAVVRDDDPASPLSTVSRGREIWAEEDSVHLGTNESLSSYALRRLKELQSPARIVEYDRRFDPNVKPGDLVRINHPEIGVNGTFRIQEQKIELTYGAKTSETAVMEDTL